MFKKIHRELKKESCRKIGNGFLVMALICCLMFVSYQATSAVITSAKVGDRELPIYCVESSTQLRCCMGSRRFSAYHGCFG